MIVSQQSKLQSDRKNWTIFKAYNSAYNDAEKVETCGILKCSALYYHETSILNNTTFNFSLHMFREITRTEVTDF